MKDIKYMELAYKEALKAYKLGEVPVGAVIVHKDKVIAKAHNEKEKCQDATKHAEMIAISQASKVINDWRLSDCTIYVTLEPCAMCASAIIQSRLNRVVYGVEDNFKGAVTSSLHILENNKYHQLLVSSNIMEKEIRNLMNKFFDKSRS